MGFDIARGVFPTMITPFTEDHRIDYDAVDALIEYYARCGCAGVFADCQSSEMFYLSEAEKRKLTRHVVDAAKGRMQIVASGHTADDPDEQVRQLADAAEAGAAASVIVLNRVADQDDGESVARRNIERILTALPDVTFGVYECPHPYKRVLSADLLKWIAETGKFAFLKDTCCDLAQIKAKCEAVKGTGLKIFNANAATLLESLRMGCAGYSGVMANFHASLYAWLVDNFEKEPERAEKLMDFIGAASMVECQVYPVNCKYHMNLMGVKMDLMTRTKDAALLTGSKKLEIDQFYNIEQRYIKHFFG